MVDELQVNGIDIIKQLQDWLQSCRRHGRLSRNTIAVGIVVIHSLTERCPLTREDIISAGGEIVGSRSRLSEILNRYGIPERFLREVTTRQAHQDGQRLLDMLKYGKSLCRLDDDARSRALSPALDQLVEEAQNWLRREHLKIACNRSASPAIWIRDILTEATGRSGGVVEQHLVGAKLQTRFPNESIPNYPSHAGDAQTGRPGDFLVGTTSFHVTAAPSLDVIKKCALNVTIGLHPVLLVPRTKVSMAVALTDTEGVLDQLSIIAIEDFISLNVIELSAGQQQDYLAILRKIINAYNDRLAQVETDMSLQIEIR